MMRQSLLLSVAFLWLAVHVAMAADKPADEAAVQKQLQRISQQIAHLRAALDTASAEEKKLVAELQQQDQRINVQHQRIRHKKEQIKVIQRKIEDVRAQIAAGEQRIHSQKQELANLLKLAVYTRHDLALKRLLLTEGSRRDDLAGHQIRYLQHRLFSLVKTVASELQQLQALHNQLKTEQQHQQEEQQRLLAEQDKLQQQRQQRAFVLAALRQKMQADKSEIRQLDRNRQRLNQLLTELKNLLDDLPDNLGAVRFARLKGRLPPPVSGAIIHAYGAPKGRQGRRWEGLVFAATAGEPVKAVAYGRVAFADWLRGYGLLVVMDHGDGYMSLYGHNEALLVEPGDWVDAGEEIALAGNSGALAQPALYFELRHNAQPVNPQLWLKKP